MTRNTRHSVVVEWPFDMRILRQRASKKRRRVMTRLAVAREFNSLLRLQILDVLLVERLAKGVAVRRLPPLCMSICVTGPASFCQHEHFSRNKRAGRSRGITGRERIRTEFEVVRFRYLARIDILVAVFVGFRRSLPAPHEYGRGRADQNQTCESGYRSPRSGLDGLRIISFGGEHFDYFRPSADVPENQTAEIINN